MTRRRFGFLATAAWPALSLAADDKPEDLKRRLEEIRVKHDVPALTAGLVTGKGLVRSAAAGVRRAGGSTPVGDADLWHYGSMTKAMTAMLLGTYVAGGKLKWDATLAQLLPDLVSKATPKARSITLRHLLTHRSGLPANLEHWGRMPVAGNRPEIVRRETARELLSEPGSTYLYSNVGYVVAGVVAERLGGGLWERVITERLFKPLSMKMGFGGTGTKGREDQPWPHFEDGKPRPSNGADADNPPSLGPAGTCHGTLAEYAKFVADQLQGSVGKKALLPANIYTDLHTPPSGADYALGWRVAERDWAGGTVLNHTGSNTMNYSVIWMAPAKGFAVVAASNRGGDKTAAACDEACSLLIGMGPP
jgi:CubicO group peptidase (beta-lactamase class C family)